MSTNHYRRAEELLDKAAALENTPKHTVAKALATMAQAHATLAEVKSVRQQTELLEKLLATFSNRVAEQPTPELSDEELATVCRFEATPDALTCRCATMQPGEACPVHDEPLPSLFTAGAFQ